MENQELISAIRIMLKEELEPLKRDVTQLQQDVTQLQQNVTQLQQQSEDNTREIKGINDRLTILEIKHDMTHKKLDDLILDRKIAERCFRKDIAKLQDGQETIITVLEKKNILPTDRTINF